MADSQHGSARVLGIAVARPGPQWEDAATADPEIGRVDRFLIAERPTSPCIVVDVDRVRARYRIRTYCLCRHAVSVDAARTARIASWEPPERSRTPIDAGSGWKQARTLAKERHRHQSAAYLTGIPGLATINQSISMCTFTQRI